MVESKTVRKPIVLSLLPGCRKECVKMWVLTLTSKHQANEKKNDCGRVTMILSRRSVTLKALR